MKHNPFESWILDDVALDSQQRETLEEHLARCPRCAQLSAAVNSALQSVRELPEMTAPPRFTQRWSASLAARKQAQETKQARTLAIVLVGTALLVALISLYIFSPEFSLISLAAGIISTIIGVVNSFHWVVLLLTGLFQKVTAPILIISGFLLASWILLAIFTLGLTVWKLAFRQSEANK